MATVEVEEGKRIWQGGLRYLRDGERSGVCTDLPIAVCSLTKGEGGGGGVYVRLCRLCRTGSNRKLEKGKNLHVWVWEPVLQDSALQRGAPILSGCEVGGYNHTFPEIHTQARALAFSHFLVIPSSQHSPMPRLWLGCPSPHRRGCLFLLSLSMLSLFQRLCHRFDARNKVRRCV